MLLTLYTEQFFSAAHCIEGYDGKCARLHGHTWKVCVWVKGEESQKQENGILWDFDNLKKITSDFDHTYLNESMGENATVENITARVYQALKQDCASLSFKVRVYESLLSKRSYCETGDF